MGLKINTKQGGNVSKLIRSFFTVPNSDYVLAEADAAGFQLRICAALSGDENMKYAFTDLGGDMHSMTSKSIFFRDADIDDYHVVDEQGQEWHFTQYSQLRVQRKNKEITIDGSEIDERDKILEVIL